MREKEFFPTGIGSPYSRWKLNFYNTHTHTHTLSKTHTQTPRHTHTCTTKDTHPQTPMDARCPPDIFLATEKREQKSKIVFIVLRSSSQFWGELKDYAAAFTSCYIRNYLCLILKSFVILKHVDAVKHF